MKCSISWSCFFLLRLFLFADYDDYLDDDDLDLIEENLGVKVKRRVRIVYHHYFLCRNIEQFWPLTLCLTSVIFVHLKKFKLRVLMLSLSCFTEEEIWPCKNTWRWWRRRWREGLDRRWDLSWWCRGWAGGRRGCRRASPSRRWWWRRRGWGVG